MNRKRLFDMLKDEKKAPIQYKKLLETAKTKQEKNTIRGIIKQEKLHYKKLRRFA